MSAVTEPTPGGSAPETADALRLVARGRQLPRAAQGPARGPRRELPRREGRIVRPGGRIRLRQVDDRPGRGALPGAQRARQRGHDRDRRHRCARPQQGPAARAPCPEGVDGLPGARPRAEPVDPRRPPGRRGLRDRRAGRQGGVGQGPGHPHQGPHLGPQGGHGALSPPALRWDAAARRHRHGAGRRAVAAHPRRADDRAGRHGGGRGAGPHPRPAPGVRHLAVVHQPQPGGDRSDVRSRGRAVRRRARGGRGRHRGLQEPAAPLHRRAAALHPPPRRRCDPRRWDAGAADDDPRLAAGAGVDPRGLHLRRALRVGRGPLPHRGTPDV